MSIYKGEKLVAGRSVNTHLVRRPAWEQVVEITALPFTAPDDGTLVLIVGNTSSYGGRNFYIDDIKVGEYQSTSSSIGSMSTLTFPICKGQVLSSKGEYTAVWGSYKFVPFEDSAIEVGTSELIRNLHDPDWSQAVSITATQLIEGYTVPKRGIIVGSIIPNTYDVTGAPIIKINGIVVTYARGSSNEISHGSVQCPVCANDRASLEGISADSCDAHISFVPYKAQ